LLDEGSISKDEARTSRYRNVITRALGVRPDCEADIGQYDAVAGDVYLLCSDGLTNMLSDSEILATLAEQQQDLPGAVTALMERAKRAGGDDNISVIVAAITDTGESKSEQL
jgi:protein phosphatase